LQHEPLKERMQHAYEHAAVIGSSLASNVRSHVAPIS
jgi:hypothetical protein